MTKKLGRPRIYATAEERIAASKESIARSGRRRSAKAALESARLRYLHAVRRVRSLGLDEVLTDDERGMV